MLLDRIDIDTHGPLNRVELGPFSEHLNVVCGPEGSGKTAIARFLRDSLVDRQYPLGMMSSSTGRVVWADQNGMIHCRREKDGTPDGRTTIDFEPRGDCATDFAPLQHSWISEISGSSESTRCLRAIQLPESLVDGVITDTAVTNLARVVSACVAGGLDAIETYDSLPLADETIAPDHDQFQTHTVDSSSAARRRRGLRSQLADVEAELARLDSLTLNHQALHDRRTELTSRLAVQDDSGHYGDSSFRDDSRHGDSRYWDCRSWGRDDADQRRLAELCERARKLRQQQSELRHSIAKLDGGFSREGFPHSSRNATSSRYDSRRGRSITVDGELRRRLDDLDAQVIGWRRTLQEIRGLREAILTGGEPLVGYREKEPGDASLRRRRLDGLVHSVDRYDQAWDSRRRHNRKDNIRERIDSATRQIDWLLARYASDDSVSRNWYEALPASANYRATTTLGDTLRAIRNDLSHVHQHTTAGLADSHVRSDFEHLEELRQCELWLVTAIDQLISHRESLIHGAGWTANREYRTGVDHTSHRAARIERLDRVTADLDECLAEAACIRRSLRSRSQSDLHSPPTNHWIDRQATIAELRRIDQQLASFSRLQWLRERRRVLIQQLAAVHQPHTTLSPLAEAASRWLVRLSGGRLRRIEWPHQNLLRNDRFAQRSRA